MARLRRRNSSFTQISFVMLPWDMLNSKAYRDLRYASSKALPFFLGKPHCHFNDPEKYQIEVKFSYGEANRYGFASSTFHSVILDLVATGFIDPVDKGGLRGHSKSYNVFRLSKRWEKYATPEFIEIDWQQFKPRFV